MNNKPKTIEPELPIIDLELGAKILGQQTIDQAKMMIAQLVSMLPGDLEKLKSAFQAHDNQKLKDLAHYIKGGASYCGVPRLKQAAATLDQSIKANAAAEHINSAYENLCQEIESLLSEYNKMQKLHS